MDVRSVKAAAVARALQLLGSQNGAPAETLVLLQRSLLASSAVLALQLGLQLTHRNRRPEAKQPTVCNDAAEDNADSQSSANELSERLEPLTMAGVRSLLRAAMPSWKSKQGALFLVLTTLLIARTQLSVRIAKQIGAVAAALITCDTKRIASAISQFMLWACVAAAVNSGIKYCTAMLQVSFRQHLTRYLHNRLMKPHIFFRLAGLGQLDSIEHRISQDVQRWCDHAIGLFNLLFKPLIDVVVFSRDIASLDAQGSFFRRFRGPLCLCAYFTAASVLVKLLAPDYGALASFQSAKDGSLRRYLQTLVDHHDEVAMSNARREERRRVDTLFDATNRQAEYSAIVRGTMEFVEHVVVRGGSHAVGFMVCSWITSSSAAGRTSASDDAATAALTGLYARTTTMLINLARAAAQLLLSYRSVSVWKGQTSRVLAIERAVSNEERMARQSRRAVLSDEDASGAAMVPPRGKYEVQSSISFDNVNLQTPGANLDGTGAVLVHGLSFYVKAGMNVLVCGPNGSGKSSTFRMLAELWPLVCGVIGKPSRDQLFYVCQRPYMSSGTFRDQVIYPQKLRDLKVGDSALHRCLELAALGTLMDEKPHLTWDSRLIWSGDALTPGEKQKLGIARMFFHKPRFAFLDECTSALDLATEQSVYEAMQREAITTISIAHRRSVWKYHNWVLKLDGCGGFVFSPMKIVDDVTRSGERRTYLLMTKILFSNDASLVGASQQELMEVDGASPRFGTSAAASSSPVPTNGSDGWKYHTPKSSTT